MTRDPVMSAERTRKLVDDPRARPAETSWIEFKENNAGGPLIGMLISAVELHQLPPPDFRMEGDAVRTCYQHAALKYVGGQKMTNATLRERLGIDDQNAAQASRVIRATPDANLIRPADAERPRAGYVPSWARQGQHLIGF